MTDDTLMTALETELELEECEPSDGVDVAAPVGTDDEPTCEDDEDAEDATGLWSVSALVSFRDEQRFEHLCDRTYCAVHEDDLVVAILRAGLDALEDPNHPIWRQVTEKEQQERTVMDEVLTRPKDELRDLVETLQVALGPRSVGGTTGVSSYAFPEPRGARAKMKRLVAALPFAIACGTTREPRVGIKRGQVGVATEWLTRAESMLDESSTAAQ